MKVIDIIEKIEDSKLPSFFLRKHKFQNLTFFQKTR